MRHARLAGALLALLLPGAPTAAGAQITASLAAVTASRHTLAVEKAGCWGCTSGSASVPTCIGGVVPGFWNCRPELYNSCATSSPGCGAGAALPLDPDGATQYVSRGQASAIEVGLGPDRSEFRNCEGIIVARWQDAMQISAVRLRTATLTL